VRNSKKGPSIKALRNCKISVKALSKQLRKLTIITKQLIAIIIFSFVNVNNYGTQGPTIHEWQLCLFEVFQSQKIYPINLSKKNKHRKFSLQFRVLKIEKENIFNLLRSLYQMFKQYFSSGNQF